MGLFGVARFDAELLPLRDFLGLIGNHKSNQERFIGK